MRKLHAVLPAPVGIGLNSRLRYSNHGGVTRVYVSRRARAWADDAHILLRGAGFRGLSSDRCWVSVELVLYLVSNVDIDSPLKAIIDSIRDALQLDDRYVGRLVVTKIPVPAADQRVDVRCVIQPAADREAFSALSEAAITSCEAS